MHDLLTTEEDQEAAKQGWGLHHVYEMEAKRWSIRILPAEAASHVVNLARANHPLPLKALGLMSNYRGKQ